MKTTTSNSGLKVKTSIKAGGMLANHNETQVRRPSKSLKVKTALKAGAKCLSK